MRWGSWSRGLNGLLLVVAVAATLGHGGAAVAGQVGGDFNGDRRDDLAIGVPGEEVNGFAGAGAVNVLYGTDRGLRAAGDQFWNQNNVGGGDSAEILDSFGGALATGDFDNDSYDDLAIGVPGEDFGTAANGGAVSVLYGTAAGLDAARAQFWNQDSLDVEDFIVPGQQFGRRLAVGDFDNDSYDDLAVGVPFDLVGIVRTGLVQVFYGSAAGLTADRDELWHQNSPNVKDAAETDDRFGEALTVGDFDNDGYDDLAVGVPFEDIGTIRDAGAVNLLFGSAGGLGASGNQFWHQNRSRIKEAAESDDEFGHALTAGDFDDDGFDDLAVGVRQESVGATPAAGAVNVIYGTAKGLKARGNQLWHQNRSDIKEAAEQDDTFGAALAAGDFNRDGYDDLAVGTPGESVKDKSGAGAVNVIYGTAMGLTAKGNQLWHQDKANIKEAASADEQFGAALAVGRFNTGRRRDLAIGVPFEKIGIITGAGAVNVIYGVGSGLSATNNQVWHQNKNGVKDDAEGNDRFGQSLP